MFETIGPDVAPDYALLVGARAARATGKLDVADAYLQRGAVRFPADPALAHDPRPGPRRPPAHGRGAPPGRGAVRGGPGEPRGPAGEGLLPPAGRRVGRRPSASTPSVLRRAPDHRDARRGRLIALQALGAPFQAEELAQAAPGVAGPGRAGARGRNPVGDAPPREPGSERRPAPRARRDRPRDRGARASGRRAPGTPGLRASRSSGPGSTSSSRIATACAWPTPSALYETLRRGGRRAPRPTSVCRPPRYLYLERPEAGHDLYRSVLAETPQDFDDPPRPLLRARRAGTVRRGLRGDRRPRPRAAALPRVSRTPAPPTATPRKLDTT